MTNTSSTNSSRFTKGDKVWWLDPVTKVAKSGELREYQQVEGESYIDEPEIRDVSYWEWDIFGDDDKFYCFQEKYLMSDAEMEAKLHD